jgi:sulfate transport system ATP-binding protein
MTVFENVAFGLRVRPRKERPPEAAIRRKVSDLLELIQLGSMANRYPSQLSGGQRQRVALARALAIEPRILLLDEPFGALDARVRQSLRRWLRRLHDEIHVTSVFVTHDQEEALEVSDRVVIMNEGRIEQTGTPDEVFHKPASPFVMDFLGNVNLFHARVDATSGQPAWALGPSVSGATARILVRPHDLDLSLSADGSSAIRAQVTRIQTAGPLVKVEVSEDSGESAIVEISHERFRELGIQRGHIVYVTMKQSRTWVEDYSI